MFLSKIRCNYRMGHNFKPRKPHVLVIVTNLPSNLRESLILTFPLNEELGGLDVFQNDPRASVGL